MEKEKLSRPVSSSRSIANRFRNDLPAETEEPLAQAIRQVSKGTAKLYKSGLNRKAVVILLADLTKVSKGNIEKILDGLKKLEETYVEPQKGAPS